ncbi:hypothetical protein ACVWZW_006852 [Bradyrhizobium sp. F1.13.4]
MRAPLVAVIAVSWVISAAASAFAQQLQVIGNDPVAGPLCAGPLGPGPCAAVQQYILNQQQGQQPGPPRVRPMPGAPGPGSGTPNSGTAQQIAIQCAQQAGGYVGLFAACAGQNVILPEKQQAVLDCAVSNSDTEGFASCAAPHFGIQLSDDQRIVADCAMQSQGDRDDFLGCAGTRFANQHLTPEQQAVLNCAATSGGDASDFASCAASRIIGALLNRATKDRGPMRRAVAGGLRHLRILRGRQSVQSEPEPRTTDSRTMRRPDRRPALCSRRLHGHAPDGT